MFETKYPHLLAPVRVGGLLLKNRIMSSPASQAEIDNMGFLTDRNIAFYKRRAQGGSAMVTIGDCIVHETGIDHPKQVKMWEPHLVLPSLTNAAYSIKQHGAIASIQFSHGGTQCDPAFVPDGIVYGPSAHVDDYGTVITEMSTAFIHELVEAFGDAAVVAKYAGFDMCQVHAAHHWGVGQFLSREANRRTDEYGGSLENRARYLFEIIDNVRAKCGPNFPIEVRISATEFPELTPDRPDGIVLEEACELAEMLDGRVEILHCSVGNAYYHDLAILGHPSMFEPHGRNVHYAAEIKKHVKKTLIACVGGLATPEEMEEIIATGQADFCAVGRALIADPDIPNKARLGVPDDIRPCLRCSTCLASLTDQHFQKCSVNPEIGHELEHQFAPLPATKKKVLVVGGGPGGMECAAAAARRGHDVTICERSEHLGGALKFAEHETFKKDLHRFCKYLERQCSKAGVKVQLGVTVTKEFAKAFAPDAMVIAIGAEPLVLPLPGIDGENVILATEMYEKGAPAIAEKVVIMGGGLVGAEIAIDLFGKGHEVHIVEMQDNIAPEAHHYHKAAVMNELNKGVHLHPGLRAVKVTAGGVKAVEVKTGEEAFIAGGTVISSFGLRSLTAEVDELLAANIPEVFVIGDCLRPGQVTQAVHAGHNAAMDIGILL
jgi:2,4-dienoyl-CoA reductase-like NADH-dependent reductase (Old Yellow Enzyme family)/thioredoxin reductase